MIGFANIEDIRPGDYVYAKNTETGEQDYMPVLETFENEVTTTYTVTIEGESIETTYGHPFYVVDEGWVEADKLEAGDEVELADGESGTVDSVERHEHEEPVTVYNFCVLDYHTYYVGKDSVLVHNKCSSKLDGSEGGSVGKRSSSTGGPGGQLAPESGTSNNLTQNGWHVGDPIDSLTKAGNEPAWSTVKSRYWKNEAYYNPDMYSTKNLELMKKGRAPRHNTIDVPKELHHINGRNISNLHNINNLQAVWPWEHADIDPFRHYTGPRP